MRVFQPGGIGRRGVFVSPGKEFPTTDFVDANGKPHLIRVDFISGEARVPDNLGRYLIDKGIAKSSPIILPPGVQP